LECDIVGRNKGHDHDECVELLSDRVSDDILVSDDIFVNEDTLDGLVCLGEFVLNCDGKSTEGPLLVENVCMGTTGCSADSISLSRRGVFIMRVKTLTSDFAESLELEGFCAGVCMAKEGVAG